MAVTIVYNDEIDTSAIDRLQAKVDGLLDGTLDKNTSGIGRLQDRINQLHGDEDAVGSPNIAKLHKKIEHLHNGTELEQYPNIQKLQKKVNHLHESIATPTLKRIKEVELLEYKSIPSLKIDSDFGLVLALI